MIWESFHQNPHGNISIALEPSNLLDIAPDSQEWLERFQQRGLPRTATFKSGGGVGHQHHLYRRPDNCPAHRVCRSGEFDILSGGYCVAPPSRHVSGKQYEWIIPPGEFPQGLPEAPDWAVAMLRQAAEKAPKENPGVEVGDDPPVRLSTLGLAYWQGERVKQKPDGSTDRSAALYAIAVYLARAGASARTIAEAIENRDVALGFSKYFDRRDSREYQRAAAKALKETVSKESPETQASSRVLRFQSAAEIASETPEQPEWISKPWVPAESIVEVDGKIKVAGKTTLMMAMCRKVLDGLLFMGEPTMRTPIVYLTEQPRSSLREALRRADLLDREDFRVLRYQDTIGTPWKEVVEAATQECKQVGARLLVIDTLPQFAGLRGDAENSSGAALEALEPVQMVAALGIRVVVSRHDGKADRDVGDSGRGSSAWGGVADIIISVRRGEGNTSPTIRVLHSLSRFDETPDKLVIDLQDGEYVAVGTETQVALLQAKEAVLNATPDSEEEARKLKDLLGDADVKYTTGRAAVAELVGEEKLKRTGSGKRNDAYKYWAAKYIESEPPVVATQSNLEAKPQQDPEMAELFESYIRDGVATQSIERPAISEEEPVQGQPVDLGLPSEIHSVGTPTLYTTQSIKDDILEEEEGEV